MCRCAWVWNMLSFHGKDCTLFLPTGRRKCCWQDLTQFHLIPQSTYKADWNKQCCSGRSVSSCTPWHHHFTSNCVSHNTDDSGCHDPEIIAASQGKPSGNRQDAALRFLFNRTKTKLFFCKTHRLLMLKVDCLHTEIKLYELFAIKQCNVRSIIINTDRVCIYSIKSHT